MTDWDFLLTPLLVLPIVLLFRFVGCGLNLAGEIQPLPATPPSEPPKPSLPSPSNPTPPPPFVPVPTYTPYREHILGLSSVIAYWRLVDQPSAGNVLGPAVDQKGVHHGTYQVGYLIPAAADSQLVQSAEIETGGKSLIVTDTTVSSLHFKGGHVKVDFQTNPYTDVFTIEAWIQALTFPAGYEYVLFDARARYAIPGMGLVTRGFRLFVDKQQGWQVQLAPSDANVFPATQKVPTGAPTHVALTVGPPGTDGQKPVSLYGNGKLVAGPVGVTAYNRPNEDLHLLIGVGNLTDNPTQTPQYRHPVLCSIQEVVLHNTALSPQEIDYHFAINKL